VAQIIETGQVKSISELARNMEVDGSHMTRIKADYFGPRYSGGNYQWWRAWWTFAGKINPDFSRGLGRTAPPVRIR